MKGSIGLLAATLAAAAMVGDADAATQLRNTYDTAARACQGALPAFSGTLRARPLALVNEGNTIAFVTCGWEGSDPDLGRQFLGFEATLGNTTTAPMDVTCTFVHGFGGLGGIDGFPTYVTRTVTVQPGVRTPIDLTEEDLEGAPVDTLSWAQLSCQLPRGAAIHYVGSYYLEDIGALEEAP